MSVGDNDYTAPEVYSAYPTINNCRGKTSFDQAGVGAETPGELTKDDDQFDTYRKRMMLAYRFRPNPLVSWRQ